MADKVLWKREMISKKKWKKLERQKVQRLANETNQRVPDPWKEIRLKLKPIGKAYNKFQRENGGIIKTKRRTKKIKNWMRSKRVREEAALRLQEQEDRKLRKVKKIKEEKERRLKAQEKTKIRRKKG